MKRGCEAIETYHTFKCARGHVNLSEDFLDPIKREERPHRHHHDDLVKTQYV